jgi:dihydrofolate synthase/folylpolyglutamate synthase
VSTETSSFDLNDWLHWMESNHSKSIDMGLGRCRQVFDKMALDFTGIKIFIVGGTNGKGSSVAMLESIAMETGYSVLAYTSPHLLTYNERVRLDGAAIDDQSLCDAFNAVNNARLAFDDLTLTYFEMGTLAALWLLAIKKPEVAVMEVGLGGRLDVVNLLDADVSLVTTVDIDHVDWLGDDREVIGFEKAGIYRSGRTAICGDFNPPNRLVEHANEIAAHLHLANRQFSYISTEAGWSWAGKIEGESYQFSGLTKPSLPLQNASTVLAAWCASGLRVDVNSIKQGFEKARVAGRMDRFDHYLLDVAHNPQSAEYLAAQLKSLSQPVTLVLGMLADKDIEQVIRHLAPVVDQWLLVGLEVPRGQSAEALNKTWQSVYQKDTGLFKSSDCQCVESVKIALESEQAKTAPLCVVAGSFYTVGQAYEALDRKVY